MNKKLLYVFLIIMIFIFLSCEASTTIWDIELVQPPDKLEYIVNLDNHLDFTGGKIRLVTGYKTIFGISETNTGSSEALDNYIEQNNIEIRYISSFNNISDEEKNNFRYNVVTDVNFSKIGEYTVRIYHYPDKYAEYNIRVIENKTN